MNILGKFYYAIFTVIARTSIKLSEWSEKLANKFDDYKDIKHTSVTSEFDEPVATPADLNKVMDILVEVSNSLDPLPSESDKLEFNILVDDATKESNVDFIKVDSYLSTKNRANKDEVEKATKVDFRHKLSDTIVTTGSVGKIKKALSDDKSGYFEMSNEKEHLVSMNTKAKLSEIDRKISSSGVKKAAKTTFKPKKKSKKK